MVCRIADLHAREVVNTEDGLRLGYVEDVLMDTETGAVTALVVPGRPKLFGLLGREEDYVIPWESIRRLGNDIVLVEIGGQYRREKRPRVKWL